VVLTCAERRRLYGSETYCLPSRFISEIPDELIRDIRPRVSVSQPYMAASAATTTANVYPDAAPASLKLGQHVRHAKFGEGVVTSYEGQGSNARVQVNFNRAGPKWLVVGYANLERISV
jgi:DNA helicase-2/ATP-dependent DNA helicase PcrA